MNAAEKALAQEASKAKAEGRTAKLAEALDAIETTAKVARKQRAVKATTTKDTGPSAKPVNEARQACRVADCGKIASLFSKGKELCSIHRAGGREAV